MSRDPKEQPSVSSPMEEKEVFLPRKNLEALIRSLSNKGYQVVGPTIDQGAIVYAEITSADDLPHGWTACSSRESTVWKSVRTMPVSAMSWARIPGRNICSRL